MEVCGTHTMSIAKYGLRNFFKNTELVSGPGCPVCVTPSNMLEACVELAKNKNVIVTSFGDMLRVPAITSSLEKELSRGADVRVVYSVYEPLKIALENPDKEVVFAGAGFETTAPLAAALIIEAYRKKAKNLTLFSMFKSVFPALDIIAASKDLKIDGFLLPGNVASITGKKAFSYIAQKYKIPCVIAGFSETEIVNAVNKLSDLIGEKKNVVENEYEAVVSDEGNLKARRLLEDVFDLKDEEWRGFGKIAKSGFALKEKFAAFDAERKFAVKPLKAASAKGVKDACRCGDIMKGKITPRQCRLFGKKCVPENPVGPCMVSSEGVCAAYYKYGRVKSEE